MSIYIYIYIYIYAISSLRVNFDGSHKTRYNLPPSVKNNLNYTFFLVLSD